MQAIVNAIQMVLAKIAGFAGWILALIKGVFTAAFVFGGDLFIWCLDSLMGISAVALNALDLGSLSTSVFQWGSLPPGLIHYLQLLGFSAALDLIVTACIVRFTLQLIPFVRLGS